MLFTGCRPYQTVEEAEMCIGHRLVLLDELMSATRQRCDCCIGARLDKQGKLRLLLGHVTRSAYEVLQLWCFLRVTAGTPGWPMSAEEAIWVQNELERRGK